MRGPGSKNTAPPWACAWRAAASTTSGRNSSNANPFTARDCAPLMRRAALSGRSLTRVKDANVLKSNGLLYDETRQGKQPAPEGEEGRTS